RVWRAVEPKGDSFGRRPGVQARYGSQARFRTSGADRAIQRQEGIRSAPRSVDRSPGASSGSTSSSSGKVSRVPRKSVEQ
ncbi:MAG: hypothetical protein N2B05_02575, partial [Gemmatimonadales bacterium]